MLFLIELTTVEQLFLVTIGCLNSISFILFFLDKEKAKKNKRRISEKTLFLSAFALGGVGAWISMYTFRHKTKHLSFKLGISLAGLLTFGVIYSLLK